MAGQTTDTRAEAGRVERGNCRVGSGRATVRWQFCGHSLATADLTSTEVEDRVEKKIQSNATKTTRNWIARIPLVANKYNVLWLLLLERFVSVALIFTSDVQ